jgi:hypothetical protein
MHPVLLAPLAALPWLQGFFAPEGETELGSRDVIAELSEYRPPADECVADTYGGLAVGADVSDSEGGEKVLASYSQGVFVFDRSRHLLAQSQGFVCRGSADELVALTAGNAYIGTPVIALAATSGGHAENMTWLTLYRVGNGGELQPIFIGEVERHEGETTRTGTVTLVPGGLIYREPAGSVSIWIYDAERGRYIEQFTTRPMS